MDSGEISSLVTIFELLFSHLGVTTITSTEITGVVNGVIAIVGFGAALWSWYVHHQNNSTS
jgi:hypothetical protein